ncbi:phosphohydrolase [Nocardia puris]|uniref:HD domain-containing protein n=1 Tax=Nocardia puris TaxID=208602 RepID=A0A366DWY4_9NOCA|nr:hypothetical protein [Nocardia puris]MBF6210269.1 phosphohydrolase [Nocardia puris]MBF6367345.1 phosphohydrolase [Nocardia puris]MBF6457530.1 phosphohydrolase [Nocardia puris]RBO93688.1 hypothetical protein DFR74_102105 [Nocardia puris]
MICALHDIGLGAIANGANRFELDGADHAAEFLERHGIIDERVDLVWDAIAAHTTGLFESPVYRRRRPAAAWIAVEGIGIDVGGAPGDLPPGYADLVHARYPRLGGSRALADAIAAQALADPRKAPPGSLTSVIMAEHHPEIPQPTWEMPLSSSEWGD